MNDKKEMLAKSKAQKAFANIKREAGTPYFSSLYDVDFWIEDKRIVDDGLELLEVLRAYLLAIHFDKNLKVGYETIKSQRFNNLELSKKNFNRIKDWLENE